MKKQENSITARFWHTPLWLIVVGGAVIGITLDSLTHDGSISALWTSILLCVVAIRLLAGHGIMSFLFKGLIVFLVLSYWLLKLGGF
jgi:hypothetical protein